MTAPKPPPERASAVALSYRPGAQAPKVVAKGYGLLAERIVERARGAGIFVHDSPELVNLLMGLDLDQQIPETLYLAVAEVLAFVHRLEQQAGD
jgi:flagellar biosynthesis protein